MSLSFIRRNPYGALATLSLTGIAGSSYYYLTHREQIALANQTFQIPVRRKDPRTGTSRTVMQKLPVIPPDVAEHILNQNISSRSFDKDGVRWNWHTAVVASNHPIEDAHTSAVHGDWMFFGVFDGHSGNATSLTLEKGLINTVKSELSENGIDLDEEKDKKEQINKSGTGHTSSSFIQAWKNSNKPTEPFTTPAISISHAIRSAFKNLDDTLLDVPIRLMDTVSSSGASSQPASDFDSPLRTNKSARAFVEAALNGSCALLAVLDTYRRNLYVACTGDSRAVAGIWDAKRRSWSVDVLSDDQTGLNPDEVARVQSEHPEDEKDTVIKRGRVLGGLQPTRAFGDARYKWGKEIQDRISRMFYSETEPLPRPPSIHLKTPPYVTAEPVVTIREDYLPGGKDTGSKKMRFLILATDGLWDVMSSEEACALVAGHLSGLRGRINKRDLPEKLGGKITVESGGVTKSGETVQTENGREEEKGRWTFSEADEGNIAKHLIRNALGGESRKVREMLSIPSPLSRNFRDDISVIVVWWDENHVMATDGEERTKAKL
ncbi:hypothetical protein Clacol_001370 [Clathrus columnatus]|uniref:PPM-type phosphatase domain-containing protein n=1 Tax=Clathrus columnatus TaxID=1419009 RepID=A0AAV4ZZ27_9AGAM|nr:hypothetical protein Clacol_001370 [Clathrus columnatus]